MSALYSIWLMPSEADEAVMRRNVDALADRFASPRFQPHLTLVEEQEREFSGLAAACNAAAAGVKPFFATVLSVDTSDLYFRSLYARFQADGALTHLRHSLGESLALEAAGPFMPHISLAYGIAPGAEKEKARVALERELAGRPVTFDRICLVASAKTIPVAMWAVEFTVALNAALA